VTSRAGEAPGPIEEETAQEAEGRTESKNFAVFLCVLCREFSWCLLPLVYDELRKLAVAKMAAEPRVRSYIRWPKTLRPCSFDRDEDTKPHSGGLTRTKTM